MPKRRVFWLAIGFALIFSRPAFSANEEEGLRALLQALSRLPDSGTETIAIDGSKFDDGEILLLNTALTQWASQRLISLSGRKFLLVENPAEPATQDLFSDGDIIAVLPDLDSALGRVTGKSPTSAPSPEDLKKALSELCRRAASRPRRAGLDELGTT